MYKFFTVLGLYAFIFLSLNLSALGQLQNNNSSNEGIPFTFILSNTAKTSAGVFKPDSSLIRTLWSNVQKPSGTHTAYWDGKDDNGNYVADTGYQVRVLSNNVTYTWEGVVGNTSVNSSGPTVFHPAQMITNMAFAGNTCYTAIGYNETADPFYRFDISNPNIVTKTLLKDGGQTTRFITTDGNIIYYAGQYQDGITSFVSGIVPGNPDVLASFSNGTPLLDHHILYSAFDIGNTFITGMAVQTSGPYLFVAHQAENKLRIINKTTGALIHNLTIASPKELAYDNINNTLWVISGTNTVSKYPVNADGTLGAALVTLPGLTEALDVAVSPNGTKLAVIDRGVYHKVKFFDPATGTLINTLGRAETYSNPDVYDDKFYFNNTRIFSEADYGATHAFVEFQSDGSYWIGDYGNMRCQHFAADNSYINNIQYMGYSYSTQVDVNDATRVFSDFLEFRIDYSKPLSSSNGSWKFVRNWSKNIVIPTGYDAQRMRSVATLSNGRTYALYNSGSPSLEIIELVPATGIRHTGKYLDSYLCDMFSDGSQWTCSNNTIGLAASWKRKPLLGFDGDNNPLWGGYTVIENTPAVTITDPLTNDSYISRNQMTSSGIVVTFCRDAATPLFNRGAGWHIGGVKDGKWRFRALPSTHINYSGDFPSDAYEIGNSTQYSGTFMQVIDQNIFCGQNCEGWKGGQVNKHKHFWDNGLQLGEFGATIVDSRASGVEAYPGMAGNVNSGTYLKIGSNIYFYHCDEGQHAGVHRWKIQGLNTVQEQSIAVIKTGNPTPYALDYVDLMKDLPDSGTLINNTAGWTRSSTQDYVNSYGDKLYVKTKRYTYKKEEMDLHFLYYPIVAGQTSWVKRDLGTNNGLSDWQIKGELAYPEGSEHDDNFFEVLDNNDRVIVRISRPETYPFTDIKANHTSIVRSDRLYYTMCKLQLFSITAINGTITVTYAGFAPATVTRFDALANWQNPKTIRLQFYSSALSGHQIDVANLRFYKNTNAALPVKIKTIKAYQKPAGIQVNWTVEGEDGLEKYEVERSPDGLRFATIGSMPSQANNADSKTYSWLDASPFIGNNFYRVKSIDNLKNVQSSETVKAKFGNEAGFINVFPNPLLNNTFTLRFDKVPKALYNIQIINASGQTIFQKDLLHDGVNVLQTVVLEKKLQVGTYTLVMKSNDVIYSRQLFVSLKK